VVKIATTTAPPPPSTIGLTGGSVNFVLGEVYFEVSEAGVYTFTIDTSVLGNSAGRTSFTLRLGRQPYTFEASNNFTVDVTIAQSNIEGGKVTFTIDTGLDKEVAKEIDTEELNVAVKKLNIISIPGGKVDFSKSELIFAVSEAGIYTFTLDKSSVTESFHQFMGDYQFTLGDTPYHFIYNGTFACNIEITEDDIVGGKVTFQISCARCNECTPVFNVAKYVPPTEFASDGGTLDLSKGNHILLLECTEAGTYSFTLSDWSKVDGMDMFGALVTLTMGSNSYEFAIFPNDKQSYDIEIVESDIVDGKVEFQVAVGDLSNFVEIGITVEQKSDVTLLGTWQVKSDPTDINADT
ncbi:MAG: hypothetical protein K2G31_02220, partial [Clostridia bacterium]|nr:hypothetical protein [Clostridia bacterium]